MTIYASLSQTIEERRPVVLCTIVRSQGSTPRGTASKMLVFPDGRIEGTVGGGEVENRVLQEALAALGDGTARLVSYAMIDPERGDAGVCGGQVEVFVEPILPSPTLVVVGAGHVGRAVAHLGAWLGFRVVVSDDREGFCSPEVTPEAEAFYPVPLAELPKHLEITPWTYLVLTTRGTDVDMAGLPALLNRSPAYIGVIGSRRRWATTRKHLVEIGTDPEKINNIHSPIGLELNAQTPEEIAVSIMAEILMIRDDGDGRPMGIKV